MPARSRRTPDADGPGLFAVEDARPPVATRHVMGRHERAVVAALRHADQLKPRQYAAARTTLRSLAHALDIAEDKANAYAIAQTAPQLHALMRDCGLLPRDIGGGDVDPFAGSGDASMGD